MLDQNDIKQIGTLLQSTEGKLKEFVKENNKELTKDIIGQVGTIIVENNKAVVGKVGTMIAENNKAIVVQVGDFITDNVLPQIDELSKDLTEVKKTVTTLPDRDDLSRGLADVKGALVARLRMEDQKVNLLIKFLREKKILTEEQWKALSELRVFPSLESEV